MHNEPERPAHQERLIAVMQESNVPPAGADTPPIPKDVLQELEERYGSAEPVSRRILVEAKPGFWAELMAMLARPQFAIACAAVLLLVGVSVFMLPSQPDDDQVRGDPTPATLPVYWASKTAPAPVAVGMPELVAIDPPTDATLWKGNVIVFDPAQRTAQLIRNDGKPGASIDITDPTDADEWLAAHRQLSSLANP